MSCNTKSCNTEPTIEETLEMHHCWIKSVWEQCENTDFFIQEQNREIQACKNRIEELEKTLKYVSQYLRDIEAI